MCRRLPGLQRSVLALVLASLAVATPAASQRLADVATAVVTGLASGLDVGSTLACRNPTRCSESNPLAAPFFDPQHPGYLLAADAAVVAGVVLLSRTLRHSSSRTARRLWWAPAAAFTVASLVVWRSNVRQLRQCPECRRAP